MGDRPPFDPVKAAFYLVAAVIAVHCAIVVLGAALCFYEVVMAFQKSDCDTKGRLGDLLAGALAAAIAFGGGFLRKPPDK